MNRPDIDLPEPHITGMDTSEPEVPIEPPPEIGHPDVNPDEPAPKTRGKSND